MEPTVKQPPAQEFVNPAMAPPVERFQAEEGGGHQGWIVLAVVHTIRYRPHASFTSTR